MLMTVEEGKGRKLADRRSSPPIEQFKCIFEIITERKYTVIKCCALMKVLCS